MNWVATAKGGRRVALLGARPTASSCVKTGYNIQEMLDLMQQR